MSMDYLNQAQGTIGGGLSPYAEKESAMIAHQRRLECTLRQNIDEQIAQAKAAVATLEQTKDRMEKSGILDMRIDDIQRAMRF
jgi:hypothetical protein